MRTETETIKSQKPILGSLPFIGRSFRSTQTVTKRKNLMIFVTVTLVNPDGTRFHTQAERDALLPAKQPK